MNFKKLCAVLLCAVIAVCALASCGFVEFAMPYSAGEFADGVYTNTFLNVKLTLPEGWEQTEFEGFQFAAQKNEVGNISISITKKTEENADSTADQFRDLMRTDMERSNYGYTIYDYYDKEIGGETYKVLPSYTMLGFNQDYYLRIVDDYICYFCVTYLPEQKAEAEAVVASITALK